jgi:hypothetical protein
MDPQQFVDVLRLVVRDSTVSGLPKTLTAPPGRAPAQRLLEMSAWYRSLGATDQAMLQRIIEQAVDATMFGVLCVLDGSLVIEDADVRGELVLEHVGAQGRTRLNDSAISLHELW